MLLQFPSTHFSCFHVHFLLCKHTTCLRGDWRNGRTLSYIHVIIPINISRLTGQPQFPQKVTCLQSGYDEKKKYAVQLEKFGGNANNPASSRTLLHFCRQITYLLELMLKNANNLQGSLNSLQMSLPRVEEQHSGPTRVKHHPAILIGTTILSRVFGMLMGWFTHRRLNNLSDQIGEVGNLQHRLLQIEQVTLTRLDEQETVLLEEIIEIEQSKTTWVNYFALDHGRIQLHFHIQKLNRVLQAAHLR